MVFFNHRTWLPFKCAQSTHVLASSVAGPSGCSGASFAVWSLRAGGLSPWPCCRSPLRSPHEHTKLLETKRPWWKGEGNTTHKPKSRSKEKSIGKGRGQSKNKGEDKNTWNERAKGKVKNHAPAKGPKDEARGRKSKGKSEKTANHGQQGDHTVCRIARRKLYSRCSSLSTPTAIFTCTTILLGASIVACTVDFSSVPSKRTAFHRVPHFTSKWNPVEVVLSRQQKVESQHLCANGKDTRHIASTMYHLLVVSWLSS